MEIPPEMNQQEETNVTAVPTGTKIFDGHFNQSITSEDGGFYIPDSDSNGVLQKYNTSSP